MKTNVFYSTVIGIYIYIYIYIYICIYDIGAFLKIFSGFALFVLLHHTNFCTAPNLKLKKLNFR